MSPPTAAPPLAAEIDRLRKAIDDLRVKHFNAAERHKSARLEIDEHSDDDGDLEARRWHGEMEELHRDMAADLVALWRQPAPASSAYLNQPTRSPAQALAEVALNKIARSSNDPYARATADKALADIAALGGEQ